MLKIEDLKGKSIQELQELLTNDVTEYQAKISLLSKEELAAEEQALMDEFKIFDDYIKDEAFELPQTVTMDEDDTRKAGDVRAAIIRFLNKVECTWQTSLGVYQAIVFWKNVGPNDKIPYGAYDSTVRILGGLKYTGQTDLYDILSINNYLAPAHEGYALDATYEQYRAALHQAILARMQALEEEEAATETTPEENTEG